MKFLYLKSSELLIYTFSWLGEWKMHFKGWRNKMISTFLEIRFNRSFQLEMQKSITLTPTSCRYTFAATAAHRDSSMSKQNSEWKWHCGQLALFLQNLFILPSEIRKVCISFWAAYWYFWLYDMKERERMRGKELGERERKRHLCDFSKTLGKLQFYVSSNRKYKFHSVVFYLEQDFGSCIFHSSEILSDFIITFLSNYHIWSKSLQSVIFLWKPTLW